MAIRTKRHGGKYEFPQPVKDAAWIRQRGLCAINGEDLEKVMKGELSVKGTILHDEEFFDEENDSVAAHHVIPVQSVIPNNTEDSILKSADNCVYLCRECHLHSAHGGNTRSGGIRQPQDYLYSHGGLDDQSRKDWVSKMMAIWIKRYGPPNQ
jgi:hypothetical protein